MDPRVGELQQVIMKKDSMILHLQKQLAVYQRKFGTIDDSTLKAEIQEADQRESLSIKNSGSNLNTIPTPSSPVYTTTSRVRASISSPSLSLDLPSSLQVTIPVPTPPKPPAVVATTNTTTTSSSTPLSPTIVSKIVGKNVILDFVEDSPMFRRQLEGFDESMHGLKALLKEILAHTKEYMSAGTRFGDEESTLVEEIANKKYARALFTTSCPELDSLSSLVNEFHDTITQMQSSRVSMLLSIDALLHHSISRFLEHELKEAHDVRKEVTRLGDEYEAALGKLLSKSKQSSSNLIAGLTGGGGSSTASSLADQFNTSFNLALSLSGAVTPTGGSSANSTVGVSGSSSGNGLGTQGKSIEKETFQLRLKFELARFDLVHFLNRLESQKKFILTECFTSTLYAMLSHFHACHELIKSVEPELRRRQEALTKSRQDFDQDEAMWAQQRDILEKKLRADLESSDSGSSKSFDVPLEILSSETLASRAGYKGTTILKEGYLFVRNSMFPARNWKRKWFQIHSGKLYHNRGKHMDVSLVCDLMLSKVRECPQMNLPFCFEVIDSSQAKHLLQATSEADMQEWIEAARKSTESMLEKQSHRMSVHPEQQKFIQEIIAKNVSCADCGQTPAEWVSINLGVFLCIECSGIHRSLGSHVSKVRSLTLDSWEMPLLTLLRDHLGNELVNSFWEHTIPNGWTKPFPSSSRDEKSKWIKAKYIFHGFAEQTQLDATQINQRFLEAVSNGNMGELMWCVAHGAEVKTITNENLETALHLSAASGAAFCCDYLLLNGASLNAADKNGKLPFDAAKAGGHESIKLCLMQKMSFEQYQF